MNETVIRAIETLVALVSNRVERAYQALSEAIFGTDRSLNAIITAKPVPTGADPKPYSQVKYQVDIKRGVDIHKAPLYMIANGGTEALLKQSILDSAAKALHVRAGFFDPVKGTMKGRPTDADKAEAAALYERYFTAEVEAEFPALIAAAKGQKGASLAAATLSAKGAEVAIRYTARNADAGINALLAFLTAAAKHPKTIKLSQADAEGKPVTLFENGKPTQPVPVPAPAPAEDQEDQLAQQLAASLAAAR